MCQRSMAARSPPIQRHRDSASRLRHVSVVDRRRGHRRPGGRARPACGRIRHRGPGRAVPAAPAVQTAASQCCRARASYFGPTWVTGRCPHCGSHLALPPLAPELVHRRRVRAAGHTYPSGPRTGCPVLARCWGHRAGLIDIRVRRLPDLLTLPLYLGLMALLVGSRSHRAPVGQPAPGRSRGCCPGVPLPCTAPRDAGRDRAR